MYVYVYILYCSDGSYYVGSTHNLDQRVAAHNDGSGPRYTSLRRPVQLVYYEIHDCESSAVKRERQIKKWTRSKKEALIKGDKHGLKQLSKRRTKKP